MVAVSREGSNSWETSGCGTASAIHPFFIPASATEVKGDTGITVENNLQAILCPGRRLLLLAESCQGPAQLGIFCLAMHFQMLFIKPIREKEPALTPEISHVGS